MAGRLATLLDGPARQDQVSRLLSMSTEDSIFRSESISVVVHYIALSSVCTSDSRAAICPIATCCCSFFGHVGRSCPKDVLLKFGEEESKLATPHSGVAFRCSRRDYHPDTISQSFSTIHRTLSETGTQTHCYRYEIESWSNPVWERRCCETQFIIMIDQKHLVYNSDSLTCLRLDYSFPTCSIVVAPSFPIESMSCLLLTPISASSAFACA